MEIYFSTVVRSAAIDHGGELVRLDWQTKEIKAAVPIAATNPELHDPNPRGNTRGGRGISVVDDEVWVASYHTLRVFDRDLVSRRDLTHPLMVGLHETFRTDRGSIWVTSTAIDAALEIDVTSGKARRMLWPREEPRFQQRLGLEPLEIDKSVDNRARFLAGKHVKHTSHLHLNAIAEHAGETYALFNRFGAIVNLDRGEIVLQDRAIRGGHNLVFSREGLAHVNDKLGRHVLVFDVAAGKRSREHSLTGFSSLRPLARRLDRGFRAKRFLHKFGLASSPGRPLFVRGLSRYGGRLFVGVSPATILEIDESSGKLVDVFRNSDDVRCCIHGLEATQSA